MGRLVYWDEDVARESLRFHAEREAAEKELPDVTPAEYDPWADRDVRTGSLWRSGRGSHAYGQDDDWGEAA